MYAPEQPSVWLVPNYPVRTWTCQYLEGSLRLRCASSPQQHAVASRMEEIHEGTRLITGTIV